MRLSFNVASPVAGSPRIDEIEQLFGYRAAEQQATTFDVELPDADANWKIGAIVGPSGSGKSLVAARAFPKAYRIGPDVRRPWPRDRALVDSLDDSLGGRPLEEATDALGAVGLNSAPAWTRPFHTLSQGERFRAELARALLSPGETIVADEFTSALDRDVAKSACYAIGRRLRSMTPPRRLVAVTCHQDVLAWLDPDWVLNMTTGRLSWRRLRRPSLVFNIFSCHRGQWRLFRKHHYLNDADLHTQSECYAAVRSGGAAAAFVSLLAAMGMRRTKRISRLVVMPEFQGLGLGRRLADWIGERCRGKGLALRITTAHPAMLAALDKSASWRLCRRARVREHTTFARWTKPRLLGRILTTYEYQPEA